MFSKSIMKTLIYFVILINQKWVDGARFPSSTLVNFDPYISILDKDNRFRYTSNDLSPLVSMVAKEFSAFFIEFTEDDFDHASFPSGIFSLTSVAAYNFGLDFNRVEVWMSLTVTDVESTSIIHLNGLRENLGELARIANNNSNPTVTTVLLPFYFVTQVHLRSKVTKSNTGLKWGWVVNAENCANSALLFRVLNPDVILLRFPSKNLINLGPSEVIQVLKSALEDCRDKLELKPHQLFKLGIIVSLPDTDETGKVNVSRLVETWGELRRWSEINGTTVVLSKAFDTPYEKSVELKTAGWWRLRENPNYKDVTDYKFERKEDIAKDIDLKENEIRLSEQDSSSIFVARNYTGVILSLLGDIEREGFSKFPESELQPFLKNVSENFSAIVVLLEDNIGYRDSPRLNITRTELRGLSEIKNGFNEIILLILPHVDVADYLDDSTVLLQVQELVSTYIVPFSVTENQSEEIVTYLKRNVLSKKAVGSYKFGYAFSSLICSEFYIMNKMEREKINEAINHPNLQKILFYFDEDKETVKLGANRMFQQRLVIFEQCKKFIAETKTIEHDNGFVFGFVMLHYATNRNFHVDPRALKNFVKYWEMLSAWALSTGTIVILGDAMDGQRQTLEVPVQFRSVGWWRYHENEWVDKRTEALREIQAYQEKIGSTTTLATTPDYTFISTNQSITFTKTTSRQNIRIFPEPTETFIHLNLNTGLIILITVGAVLLCTVVGTIITVFLVRKYFREAVLTKDEFYEFLHGSNTRRYSKDDLEECQENESEITVTVYKRPYDKTRYEIEPRHFSIDNGGILGAGEFGKVCRGNIENNHVGNVEVAVKLANADKAHKTALKGLLSEIKILAHIGKHDNITEMIGANTSDLKQGKVYIFLELCQLGSLEKYIRKLRPSLDDNQGEEYVAESNSDKYQGIEKNKTSLLDSTVYDDFYKWSTEICCGMAYLATKHVVHADLAARNVLLNAKKEAKLCDFGLSRRMYNYTNYVKTQQEPLPWKWMAPESLRLFEFNEKTDVWAFGVTLWEIYSLGDNPYPGLSYDVNFPSLLEQGLRLTKPKYDDKDIFLNIVTHCWKLNPVGRPSFEELLNRFTSYPSDSDVELELKEIE